MRNTRKKIGAIKEMTDKLKKYETIGCCGIDCGLCPRFHTKGDSACPGCGGGLAKKENTSINQLVSSALAEKISSLMAEDYIEQRAKRASKEKFRKALQKVADTKSDESDR